MTRRSGEIVTMIMTRIRKIIGKRRKRSGQEEENYDKEKRSDINKENRQGDKNHDNEKGPWKGESK